jgi:hypothetical protein
VLAGSGLVGRGCGIVNACWLLSICCHGMICLLLQPKVFVPHGQSDLPSSGRMLPDVLPLTLESREAWPWSR